MSKWQPIETAPHSEYVLLYGRPGRFLDRPKPSDFQDEPRVIVGFQESPPNGLWRTDWENDSDTTFILATHWAPLPAPPA